MQRLRLVGLILMIPAFAFLAAGCGGSKDTGKPATSDGGGTSTGERKAATAVEGKGTATVRGVVTYDGDLPKIEKLAFTDKAEAHCHKGDTEKLIWEIGPNKGIKGVVVWVKAGPDKYFASPEGLRKRADVLMDQPYCNFKPHVVAMNTTYFDGKKQVPTGQKFTVKNSAPINHNTNWEGNPAISDNKDNKTIAPNGELSIPLKPCTEKQAGREDKVNITCNIHTWMGATAWVFDHPFYAVTDAEGKFEIKDVPAGAELFIVAWHEEAGDSQNFLLPVDKPARTGQKVTLEAGKDFELNFKIKKK